MNTNMWTNPFTERHLNAVREVYNLTVVDPIAKVLQCKDVGIGGIADTETIVNVCTQLLPLSEDI